MKRSNVVLLAVLGSVYTYSIFHHDNVYRDRYNSRDECKRDWGNAGDCLEEGGSSGSSGSHFGGWGHYYGPSYEEGARPATNAPGLAQSRSMITRGGFGRSGAFFSRGG